VVGLLHGQVALEVLADGDSAGQVAAAGQGGLVVVAGGVFGQVAPIRTSVVSSSNFICLSSGLRLVLLFDSVRGVAVMGGRVQGILVLG
jgi:hypothetical protein